MVVVEALSVEPMPGVFASDGGCHINNGVQLNASTRGQGANSES